MLFRLNQSRSFTVIEMLVVIAVVTVMSAMLFVGIRAARRFSSKVKCMNNLKQIGTAMTYYAGRHNGFLPALDALSVNWTVGGTWATVPAVPRVPWYEQLQNEPGHSESFAGLFVCPMQITFSGYRADDPVWTSNHLSYGLNADVKDRNGVPYRKKDASGKGTDTTALTPADLLPDLYNITEIKDPAHFILAADSSQREITNEALLDVNARYRIAPRLLWQRLPPHDLGIGMWHTDEANVLYGDIHVNSVRTDINGTGNFELWTLPAD